MFKVGQKVWDIRGNKYCVISEIVHTNCGIVYDIDIDNPYYSSEEEIHETAEDMLKALGFVIDDNEYANWDYQYLTVIEEIYNDWIIVKDNKVIEVFLSKNDIEKKEEAIHQLMTELKAREGK